MGETEKDLADASHINDIDAASSDAILLATGADTSTYSPWSLPMFRLYGVLSIAYLWMSERIDGSLMGAINAMTSYQNYYGVSVLFPYRCEQISLTSDAVVPRALRQDLCSLSTTLDLFQMLF
jgi:hypothetical protein